ncbi:MAG: hypothetical protein K6C32_00685 [Bacilli bacterium]|nr:hypothetical protein [Bacilli bacterium]
MGESRVEKFKDYRKSMIHDGELSEKVQINTDIEENSVNSKNRPTYQEELLLKELKSSRLLTYISYFGFLLIIIACILTFGLILF